MQRTTFCETVIDNEWQPSSLKVVWFSFCLLIVVKLPETNSELSGLAQTRNEWCNNEKHLAHFVDCKYLVHQFGSLEPEVWSLPRTTVLKVSFYAIIKCFISPKSVQPLLYSDINK